MCQCLVVVSLTCRREALSTWKLRLGSKATYMALMKIFVDTGRVDCAETIVDIMKEGAEITSGMLGNCA